MTLHPKCFDRSDHEPELDDVTQLRDDRCEGCGAPLVVGWDDNHGWSDVSCPCEESEPCVTCGFEHATREAGCGHATCREHYDAALDLCKRCSDGPSEPDYATASAGEVAEAARRGC